MPAETEMGRMTLWDKCLTAALNAGKDIHEAIQWAETAVDKFEARFHAVVKKDLTESQIKEFLGSVKQSVPSGDPQDAKTGA